MDATHRIERLVALKTLLEDWGSDFADPAERERPLVRRVQQPCDVLKPRRNAVSEANYLAIVMAAVAAVAAFVVSTRLAEPFAGTAVSARATVRTAS